MPDPVALRTETNSGVSVQVTEVHGSPAVVFKIDGSRNMGALSHESGLSIAQAAQTAKEKKLPLVGYISSVGADLNLGVPAIHGWGMAAREIVSCSGIVPQIFCIHGPAVSGPALLWGIADISIMVEGSYAFVSGPAMVRQFTGVDMDVHDLGGYDIHHGKSGVASFTASSLEDAEELVGQLLSLLPPSCHTLPRQFACDDSPDRLMPEAEDLLPDNPSGSYDVRWVLKMISDENEILELSSHWADNLVVALATIGGHPVGLVANQPLSLAGTLNIAASQKGARFVSFCDAFNIPLVTFVDTPGFQPGKDLEWRGMIRNGAQLAFAYARATVPRICVTLRKSYGGAYIVMDSKKMGNDLSYAWPSAEIAVMGAKGAVEILNRDSSPQEREDLERQYSERHLNPYRAAERGSIDMVIEPAQTRKVIADALNLLQSKREEVSPRRHDNTPL